MEREAQDETLAADAAAGDPVAFSALVSRHYDFVHRVAFRLAGNAADADDIAQEVCVRAGRSIRTYRGGGRFTTWLYALTLNAVRDMARKSARDAARARAYGMQAMVEGDAAVPDGDDPAQRLWEAVRRLPDKQREAVTLVYGEGMSHAQAGDVLACSEGTVSWHLHEARKRLREMVAAGDE